MNNQSLMMIKKPAATGVDEYVDPNAGEQAQDFAAFQSGTALLPRNFGLRGGQSQDGQEAAPEKEIPGTPGMAAPVRPTGGKAVPPAAAQPVRQTQAPPPARQAAPADQADAAKAKISAIRDKAAQAVSQATDAVGQARAQKPAAQPAQQKAAPAAQAAKPTPKPIRNTNTPDGLCQIYMKAFKDTLGLDLSSAIVFDNMRRICEADVKDPQKTLFFLENTYRVSTLLYLSANLPILVVTSILAEKNRKNILKYVTTEVENGAKPYDELLALRVRRWGRKYENMAVNDAMTVTPGATKLSPSIVTECQFRLLAVSQKLKKFNGDLTQMVSKFDDATRNDVTFIYSNWWYLLQGFENVPEMRTYVMAITDDTRKNLKI